MYTNDDRFEMFSCISQFVTDNGMDIKPIKQIITDHLIHLQTSFNTRFEDFSENV